VGIPDPERGKEMMPGESSAAATCAYLPMIHQE